MRTRRQDKAAAAAAAMAATTPSAEREEAPVKAVSSPIDDSDKKDEKTGVTTVTISKIEGPTVNVNQPATASKSRSRLPTPVQFPLVAVLSLAISELGYSLSWPLTQGVLAAHARLPSTGTEIGAIMGWRLCVPISLAYFGLSHVCGIASPFAQRANNVGDNRFELALGWFGEYDGYDITALNLLSQGPPVSRLISSRAHGLVAHVCNLILY